MAKPNNPPVFTDVVFELQEGASTGSLVIAGADYVRDRGDTLAFTFSDPSSLFAVNASTGDITFIGVPANLDFETTTSYTLQITATDSANNIVTNTVTVRILDIDETPPNAPTLLLASASDTGISNTDKITRTTLPTVNGTAQKGTTVEIYDNTLLVATVAVKNNGAWTYNFTQPLSEGAHVLTAVAVKPGGIKSVPTPLAITIDTTAPTTTVTGVSQDTGPSSTDGVTSDSTLIFNGTSEANSSVRIFSGAVLLGTTTANAIGDWAFDYTQTNLPPGAYNITAAATDVAGNVGASSAIFQLTISTGLAAPASLDLAAASDTGASSTDNLTSDSSPTISGTAAAGLEVRLYDTDGTTLVGSGVADAGGVWSITASALVDGIHSLTAKALDSSGNLSGASTSLVVTIDTVAPAAPTLDLIAASDSGSSSTDNLTNDSTPTISGTATAGVEIKLYDTNGTTLLGSSVADADGVWSITSSVLTDGIHSLTAKAVDAAGNVSIASTALAVTVDTIAPAAPTLDLTAASDSGSSSTDNITNDSTPTLSGTASAGLEVRLYDTDGTTVLGTGVADAGGIWSITSSLLTHGIHSLTAKAVDAADNVSIASDVLTLTLDIFAPNGRALWLDRASDSGTSNTDNLTNDSTPTLSSDSAEANSVVELFSGAVSLGTTTANGSGNWIFTTDTLPDGSHYLTYKATDIAGNTSYPSSELVLRIDTMAPVVTLVSGSFKAVSGIVRLDATVDVNTVKADFSPKLTALGSNGDYAVAWIGAEDNGRHSIYVQAFNGDGTFKNSLVKLEPVGATTGHSTEQKITSVGADGKYVVTWRARDNGGDDSIFVQLFNSDGTIQGNQISLDTPPVSISFDRRPAVTAVGNDGKYVVAWLGSDNNRATRLYVQPFNADGTPKGNPLNLSAGDVDGGPQIAAVGNAGEYVVTWELGGVSSRIFAQRFLADDTLAAPPIIVSASVPAGYPNKYPQITAVGNSGEYAITWHAAFSANSLDTDPVVQLFNPDDSPRGSMARLQPEGVVAGDSPPQISAVGDVGKYVVVWETNGSIYVQLFNADGTVAHHEPVLVEAQGSSVNHDSHAQVAAVGNEGEYVVTWRGYAADVSGVVLVQAFNADGTPKGNALEVADIRSFTSPQIIGVGSDDDYVVAWDGRDFGFEGGNNASVFLWHSSVTVDVALVSSSEPGTAYAVNNALTVNSLSDITNAADNVWNSVEIALAGIDTYVPKTGLADGVYHVYVVDAAGNLSSPSASFQITTQVTPGVPAALDLIAASDSGLSSTDNLTNDSTPTISGTAPAAVVVRLYDTDGATLLGSGVADAGGVWSITSSLLADGFHSLTAKAIDDAGNASSASTALVVTVDTVAPVAPTLDLIAASDSGSSSTDNITNDSTPTISGTAAVGAEITLYDTDGTAVLGSVVADAGGLWSITASVLPDGIHSLTAKATDAAGNVSFASTALVVTVDTIAPAAPTLDLIAASDSGSSSTDDVTSDSTPTISGIAAAGVEIRLYDTNGTTVLGTAIADAGGIWSITSSLLTDGVHSLTTKAIDTAGNVSIASNVLAVTVDTIAPAAPTLDLIAASDSGSSSTDNITSDSTPTISGTAVAGVEITLYDTNGSTVIGTGIADAGGVWSITASALADGVHSLTAKAIDAAGNISIASNVLAVTVDTIAPATPTLDLISASDSGDSQTDNVTNDNTPTVSGTAEANSTVELFNGVVSLGTTGTNGAGNWSFTSVSLTDGVHNLTAKAIDVAGNPSTESTVLTLTVDTVAPVVTLVSGGSGSDSEIIQAEDSATIKSTEVGTAYLVNSTLTVNSASDITSAADDLWNSSAVATANTDTPLSKAGLLDGTYKVYVVDVAGNLSSPSATFEITTGPAAPTGLDMTAASDSGLSDSDNVTIDSTPTIVGVAAAGLEVRLYDSGGVEVVGSGLADTEGNWSITTAPLTEGSHTLTARAMDNLGNFSVASSALAVVIDVTAPSVSAALDLAAGSDGGVSQTDNLTDDNTPTLTGTTEANSVVEVFDLSVSLGTTTASSSGTWSFTSGALTDGIHYLTYGVTDVAGNTNYGGYLQITIDTAAPVATLVSGSSDSGSGIIQLNTSPDPDPDVGKTDYAPQIAAVGTGGDYVVTWYGYDVGDEPDLGIYVQAFNADMTFKNAAVRLQAAGVADQVNFYPKVTAVDDDGKFVITWTGIDVEGEESIFVQLFDADGTVDGDQRVLEPRGDGSHVHEITALGSNGEYAVTWTGVTSDSYGNVFVQLFNADGSLKGGSKTLGSEFGGYPQIAAVGNSGGYVVTWTHYSLLAQRFLADGSPASELVHVTSISGYGGRYAQITAVGDVGEYAIAWLDPYYLGGSQNSVFVQLFNADDTRKGDLVHLPPEGLSTGLSSSLGIMVVGNSGKYVVSWQAGDIGGDDSVFVQLFNEDGTVAHTNPVVLEAEGSTDRYDGDPQIAAVGGDGEYVVAWKGASADGYAHLLVQAFNADGSLNGSAVEIRHIDSVLSDLDISSVGNGQDYVLAWQARNEQTNVNDNSISVWHSSTADDSAIVRSSETGVAYLVNSTLAVNSVGDITSAADSFWNSVGITNAGWDTYLTKTGLVDGVYDLYTSDDAGNLSEVVLVGQVVIDNVL